MIDPPNWRVRDFFLVEVGDGFAYGYLSKKSKRAIEHAAIIIAGNDEEPHTLTANGPKREPLSLSPGVRRKLRCCLSNLIDSANDDCALNRNTSLDTKVPVKHPADAAQEFVLRTLDRSFSAESYSHRGKRVAKTARSGFREGRIAQPSVEAGFGVSADRQKQQRK